MPDDATEQVDDLDGMHEVEKEVLLQLDGAVDSSDEASLAASSRLSIGRILSPDDPIITLASSTL